MDIMELYLKVKDLRSKNQIMAVIKQAVIEQLSQEVEDNEREPKPRKSNKPSANETTV